jgi:hypothetical protein
MQKKENWVDRWVEKLANLPYLVMALPGTPYGKFKPNNN